MVHLSYLAVYPEITNMDYIKGMVRDIVKELLGFQVAS